MEARSVARGPATKPTSTAGQSIIATSEASLGTSAGTALAAVSICDSPAGGMPAPTLLDPAPGTATSAVDVNTNRLTYTANGTGSPGAGTWLIGECAENLSGTQAIDVNDWALGDAFVVNGSQEAGSSNTENSAAGASASHPG